MTCGTVLGTYPGVLRSSSAFHDVKCRAHPRAVSYSWAFGDGSDRVIDPTDEYGALREICLGGSPADDVSTFVHSTLFRCLGKSTILCRINEPPIGVGGCSVSAREDGEVGEVVFVLIRDVEPGMELYMDYGLNYDRSGYGPASS
ncbi:hypothetical protein ACHAW5_004221 [Stephanodiscus triporus]|uniref:SET domain-containing protein n=1 Tax=Stephanodiscus triporus TaxID=2934178 RepID=A0ABD3NNI4_9STRA